MTRINLLFVCSRNQWRSPTAEQVYRNDPRFSVRSCGVSDRSPRTISESDLRWADVVFVMEKKHRTRITDEFRSAKLKSKMHVLEIPDDFHFMDPELIELIRERVEDYFDAEGENQIDCL